MILPGLPAARPALLAALAALAALACGCGAPSRPAGPGEDPPAPPGALPPAPPCTVEVATAAALSSAVAAAHPGTVVCLAPGTYALGAPLRLGAAQSGTAGAPVVIRARDGAGTAVLDGTGAEEVVAVTASHLVLRELELVNGNYHAVKIDPPASDLSIVGNRMHDNTRADRGDGAQFSAVKGCCKVERVELAGNAIWQSVPFTGSNIQGIDCNGCGYWTVRGNAVRGIHAAPGSSAVGVAVQFKSGSLGTVVEANDLSDSGIGISLGGFGNPAAWGYDPYWEHVGGVVRNNVIRGCVDAGISVILAKDGRVLNNTLHANGFTPDVRRGADNLRYWNNVLDRALNLRDGTTADRQGNVVLASPSDPAPFVDAAGGDLHLGPGAAAFVDRGVDPQGWVPTDHDGTARPRGAGWDVGAYER
jgi:hypothetical protein